ncbi:MAG: DUF5615 family PIN-like protein [Phycisphaeraceae bacterium]|nr:DUF5615 family PIN-like protein [Phycisphaeraceae bacterium]
MRFLADENISPSVIQRFREAGHDVLSVKQSMAGSDDALVLHAAVSDRRVLVTHDKDFGDLAFRSAWIESGGVILFRLTPQSREQDVQRIVEILCSRNDWSGTFWAVTDTGLRRRVLPRTQTDFPPA